MDEYWVTGAGVVDGTGADPREVAIGVRDGRIVGLGSPPPGVNTVDASGLIVTPGLIDAHVHFGLSSDINASQRHDLSVAELAADMFANCAETLYGGFTTVRDTGGIDAGLAQVVSAGKVPGPRILQCGPLQCQTGGHGHFAAAWEPTADWRDHDLPGLRSFSLLSDSPDEMRKNVREAFRRGARFIKLCVTGGVVSTHDELTDTQFSVEEIAVAVQEARARDTYVTVHAHNNSGIRNAVAAGVACVEHGSSIDEETAALMAGHDVALVPTLAVAYTLAEDATSAGVDASIKERVGIAIQGQIDGLLAARAGGVRVGLGSDLIGPSQSGRGQELVLRSDVESPMLALESATRINADIIGLGNEVGTLEDGKLADLTAFTIDPLENPTVFGDRGAVALVIKGGEIVKDARP